MMKADKENCEMTEIYIILQNSIDNSFLESRLVIFREKM